MSLVKRLRFPTKLERREYWNRPVAKKQMWRNRVFVMFVVAGCVYGIWQSEQVSKRDARRAAMIVRDDTARVAAGVAKVTLDNCTAGNGFRDDLASLLSSFVPPDKRSPANQAAIRIALGHRPCAELVKELTTTPPKPRSKKQ